MNYTSKVTKNQDKNSISNQKVNKNHNQIKSWIKK